MSFMGVLLILLIVVLALATFVESAYDTATAWAVVYGTHWFEILMILIAVNIAGVMFRLKFFNRKKIRFLDRRIPDDGKTFNKLYDLSDEKFIKACQNVSANQSQPERYCRCLWQRGVRNPSDTLLKPAARAAATACAAAAR